MKGARYKWQPLQRAVAKPITSRELDDAEKVNGGMSRDEIFAMLTHEDAVVEYWLNDTYQVAKRYLDSERRYIHLNIRRRDGGPILRDWRHFQTIKNELVGEECEAIELYPAESRLVDTSNKYHLFAIADPTFRFPFGDIWGDKRDVSYLSGKLAGNRQRPL